MRVIITALALGASVILLAGCKTSSGAIEQQPVTNAADLAGANKVETEPAATETAVDQLGGEAFAEPELGTEELTDTVSTVAQEIEEGQRILSPVYFAYDSDRLSDEALKALETNARWLVLHPALRVVIEGHCDERGSIEYNLDLGAKRARAVRDHLSRLGIAPARLETISYGEERPADPGRSESAWARNRRAEFVLEAP